LAIAALTVQILGALVAPFTHLMLHGDGAYFVYALSVGEPWLLKWRDVATRASIYIITVVPTQWISQGLHLSPLAISDLNGLVFYLIPALQFGAACALVWRRNSRYLIFPTAQYILSTSLGFGFPSEILLAPGFLWICLFLTLDDRDPSILFFASLLGLVFSHELAIPAAFVAIALAIYQARARDYAKAEHWRLIMVAIASASVLILWAWVRLTGGGGGSDSNVIYVFDPRRVFNNVTAWLVIASVLMSITLSVKVASWSSSRTAWCVAIIAAAAFPVLLRLAVPTVDFDQGRYDSARTIVGVVMFALAMAFVRARLVRTAAASHLLAHVIPLALAVGLASSAGAGTAFMIDWMASLRGLERVVLTASGEPAPKFISSDEAQARMPPDEAGAFNRIAFSWTLPYRSIVLANGREPAHIVYGTVDYRTYCRSAHAILPAQSGIPTTTLDEMQWFTCGYTAPPTKHMTRDKLIALWRLVAARLGWVTDN